MPRESPYRVAIANANVPNMLGQISTTMARAGLNIHNDGQQVARRDGVYAGRCRQPRRGCGDRRAVGDRRRAVGARDSRARAEARGPAASDERAVPASPPRRPLRCGCVRRASGSTADRCALTVLSESARLRAISLFGWPWITQRSTSICRGDMLRSEGVGIARAYRRHRRGTVRRCRAPRPAGRRRARGSGAAPGSGFPGVEDFGTKPIAPCSIVARIIRGSSSPDSTTTGDCGNAVADRRQRLEVAHARQVEVEQDEVEGRRVAPREPLRRRCRPRRSRAARRGRAAGTSSPSRNNAWSSISSRCNESRAAEDSWPKYSPPPVARPANRTVLSY